MLGLTIDKLLRLSYLWLGGTGLFFVTARTSAQQPAFPGAEGFGATALGGRSGTVYHVTNLNNTGSGSFRDAVNGSNRTIVFDVSGIINLSSALLIRSNNLTIAGQTAPGDGITLKGNLTSVQNCRNIIVRFLHCRPGDVNCPTFMEDSFHVDSCRTVMVDHISGSWCNDEVLSVTKSTNVTVQWCMITEPLNHSCHDEGSGIENHGYGSLLRYGAGGVSYHHNLYTDNLSRNPRLGDNIHLDFVNNVIYNWGNSSGLNGNDTLDNTNSVNPTGIFTNWLNYVNNYLVVGPATTQNPPRAFASNGTITPSSCQIYQSGNLIDTNKNGVLDGFDKGWASFSGSFTTNLTRLPFPQVTTDSATSAYVRVLSSVGSSLVRDAVDARIISNVIQNTGTIINSQTAVGGWPTVNSLPAPTDTDQDGMPDFWETALGSSTNNAADRNDLMPDGYTRLEWYLNWLAGPHARATNSFVDVELRQYTAALPSPTYSTFSASNGTVALLGDGHTARFTPTPSFSGLASFLFAASGSPASLTGTVSVLVSPGAAPPLTPFEQWQINYFGSTNNPTADAAFDADGDGMNNTNEFLSGTNPTNSLSALRIISAVRQTTDVVITWTTAGDRTNVVQATTGDVDGSYATNFTDITGWFIIPGSADATTNHADSGGATNFPSRFYRIRLQP